jgi:hypothetical protein
MRHARSELEEAARQIKALLADGSIRSSSSPYSAPVLFEV